MTMFVLPPYLHLFVQVIEPNLLGCVVCSYVLLLIRGQDNYWGCAYSCMGQCCFLGQNSSEAKAAHLSPQAVSLVIVQAEIVSILGQTVSFQSRSGNTDGLVDGFGRGFMMWIF